MEFESGFVRVTAPYSEAVAAVQEVPLADFVGEVSVVHVDLTISLTRSAEAVSLAARQRAPVLRNAVALHLVQVL